MYQKYLYYIIMLLRHCTNYYIYSTLGKSRKYYTLYNIQYTFTYNSIQYEQFFQAFYDIFIPTQIDKNSILYYSAPPNWHYTIQLTLHHLVDTSQPKDTIHYPVYIYNIIFQVFVAPSCYDERMLLFVVGVLAVAGQVLFIRGVALESAAVSSLMRNMDTVLAYIIQVCFIVMIFMLKWIKLSTCQQI